MRASENSLGTEQMDYERWSDLLRPLYGRHTLKGDEPNTFAGWLRRLSVSGLTAVDICCNAHRFERTHQDVRLDDRDHYKVVFQVAGHSTIYQNDQRVQLPAQRNTCGAFAARSCPRCSERGPISIPPGRFIHAAGSLQPDRRTVRAARSAAVLTSCEQAVSAHPRPHQGTFCRSGVWPSGSGIRSRDLVTLPAEALYAARPYVHRFHPFASLEPSCAPSRPPEVVEHKRAHQCDRLRLRLSRLHAFRTKISPSVRLPTGRPLRRNAP